MGVRMDPLTFVLLICPFCLVALALKLVYFLYVHDHGIAGKDGKGPAEVEKAAEIYAKLYEWWPILL